jgi:arylsulfatase A-like enzyme
MKSLLASLFFLAIASTGASAAQPNIVFLFTDDHCQQALSAYDDSRIVTPNMDRIAREGMRFNKCYVTNAICGPSRAVILTGKYSHLNGFMTNGSGAFDGSQQTFPKLVQKAGYQTALIGKWHLKSTPTGFDHYDILKGQGPYYNPPMITGGENGEPKTVPHTGYTTEIITEKTLHWLKNKRDPNKPFVLMCQHKAPHRNWMPAPKYLNWLDDVEIKEPETLWDDYSGREAPASRQAMTIAKHMNAVDLKLSKPRGLNSGQLAVWNAAYEAKNKVFEEKKPTMSEKEIIKWKYQRYVKDYLRCVKSVDDSIGEVLKYLDDNGLTENTVVMYSSDQGWYLGEHGWFDKRWMYEESLKTPLLVRWPGVVKAGSIDDTHIVSNLDFAETFLDIAGLPKPNDMQGASLMPLFKGQTPDDWRKSFYYHYYEFPGAHSVARHQGVTNGQHKLIEYYGPSHVKGETYDNTWEMFDLTKDRNELHNVYGEADYAKTQALLLEELKKLQKQYSVPPVANAPTKVKNAPAVKIQ